MPTSRDREPLTGLARSLSDLFDRAAREGGQDGEGGPPRGPDEAEAVPEVGDPAAAAWELDDQVDEFLGRGRVSGGPAPPRTASGERAFHGDVERRIRALASVLVGGGRVEPVADAVVRLTMVPRGDLGHGPAQRLARDLVSPAVAARLSARLGAILDGSRRAVLTRAFGGLGPVMAEAAAEALTRTESRSARRALTELLTEVGVEGADVLGRMVEDERWFVVRNAVLVLGEIKGAWAVKHLTGALAHPDSRVRREALMALARVGGREAGRRVVPLLTDPDERVREAAALAAGAVREEGAVRPLLELVDTGDEDAVMVAAIRALGRLGDPAATDVLERRAGSSLLSRPSAEVRIAAYRALAGLGTARARAVVRSGLHDRDPAIRAAAQELVRAGGGGAG